MNEAEKTILVTGFDPFGGETVNPAWEAVSRLPDRVGAWTVVRLQVPTVFGRAGALAMEVAHSCGARAILCVGQAGGRAALTPELIGVNLRYARLPDNAGQAPMDEPVVPGAPDGLFSTLPARRMAEALASAGLPAQVSYSAGAYVCNDLLYTLLERYRDTDVRVGFIHVPYLPQQTTSAPSMPLEDIVRGLVIAIGAV